MKNVPVLYTCAHVYLIYLHIYVYVAHAILFCHYIYYLSGNSCHIYVHMRIIYCPGLAKITISNSTLITYIQSIIIDVISTL